MSELVDLHIRATPQELADWTAEAVEFGMTLSEWIRERCRPASHLTPQQIERLRTHIAGGVPR